MKIDGLIDGQKEMVDGFKRRQREVRVRSDRLRESVLLLSKVFLYVQVIGMLTILPHYSFVCPSSPFRLWP